MRRTKIVCTIGPACESLETLGAMIRAGMNVARLNFSHGTRENHRLLIHRVREAARLENKAVAVMLDMKGPELRVGEFAGGKVVLAKDSLVKLTGANIMGTEKVIPVNYRAFDEDVKLGDRVLLDDGLITLIVEEVSNGSALCRVIDGGELSNHKGVNFPGLELTMPSLTESDYVDIELGIEEQVDFIAVSFVRKPQDVLDIRRLLEERGVNTIDLTAKIETQAGVNNIESILDVVDSVMVARGDLGVEILPEEVPLVQKTLIKQCNQAGKPVITATHMLDSMVRNPRPTRAEASDVANAIFDGTDAIMLSGETAIGKFPVEAVETMARIAVRTEQALDYRSILQGRGVDPPKTVTDAISHATCTIATDLQADAIITPTVSGFTARMVSRYRPQAPIFGLSSVDATLAHLCVVWGVLPIKVPVVQGTDAMFNLGLEVCREQGLIEKGNLVVITAGVGKQGTTNLLKVSLVE